MSCELMRLAVVCDVMNDITGDVMRATDDIMSAAAHLRVDIFRPHATY